MAVGLTIFRALEVPGRFYNSWIFVLNLNISIGYLDNGDVLVDVLGAVVRA